jgi:23S rRNA pseudouridine1911/1915/1917 synthase
MKLLYRDDTLLVCVKPAGVLSEDRGEDSAPALLRAALGGYIGVVHRLDRPVGGVMVFSRDPRMTGRLTQSFAATGEKTYLAVVSGDPGDGGIYEDLLYHDPRTNKTFVVGRMRAGVRQARLRFEKVRTQTAGEQTLSLVRVTLETGRTHQIRTQFASRGFPVVGDRRYGSRVKADGIALWSAQIAFDHPVDGRRMTFQKDPPADFPVRDLPER